MTMGTIIVKSPEGEEKEVKLDDILKERRATGSIPKFQSNTLWAAALVIVGWLAYDKVVQIERNTQDIQQLKVSVAADSARGVEQYTQMIRGFDGVKTELSELKVAVAAIAKERQR